MKSGSRAAKTKLRQTKKGRNPRERKEEGKKERADGRNSSCNSRSRIAPGPVVGPSGRVTLGEIIIGHLVLARHPSVEFGRVARVPSLPPPFVSRRRGPACLLSWRENFRMIEVTRYSENKFYSGINFPFFASEQSNFDAKKPSSWSFNSAILHFNPWNLDIRKGEKIRRNWFYFLSRKISGAGWFMMFSGMTFTWT